MIHTNPRIESLRSNSVIRPRSLTPIRSTHRPIRKRPTPLTLTIHLLRGAPLGRTPGRRMIEKRQTGPAIHTQIHIDLRAQTIHTVVIGLRAEVVRGARVVRALVGDEHDDGDGGRVQGGAAAVLRAGDFPAGAAEESAAAAAGVARAADALSAVEVQELGGRGRPTVLGVVAAGARVGLAMVVGSRGAGGALAVAGDRAGVLFADEVGSAGAHGGVAVGGLAGTAAAGTCACVS